MSRPDFLRGAIAGALMAALAACGGGTTPTPVPTAAPTAAPTPTPTPAAVDVAKEFLAQVLAARTGSLALAGTATSGSTEASLSGTLGFSGKDSVTSLTFDDGGARRTQETVRIGTRKWTREDQGPWILDPKPVDAAKGLAAFLTTLSALEDRGVETKGSRQLHHLVPPAGTTVSPDALGLDPTIKDPIVAIDFWAADDGTPEVWTIGISWNQPAGATMIPVELVMDIDLSGLGRPATVAAPEDAWERFVSERFGYSMAHPPGWTVNEVENMDWYLVEGTTYVTVSPSSLPAYTLERYLKELFALYEEQLGVKPETNEEMALGGEPARFLTYHFKNEEGVEVYMAEAIAVRGDLGWDVFLTEQAGSEKDDTPVFAAMLSTFTFTE
ncbi:MAG: hypothetical protein ABIG85_07625 [Chloroflexota bacterium]